VPKPSGVPEAKVAARAVARFIHPNTDAGIVENPSDPASSPDGDTVSSFEALDRTAYEIVGPLARLIAKGVLPRVGRDAGAARAAQVRVSEVARAAEGGSQPPTSAYQSQHSARKSVGADGRGASRATGSAASVADSVGGATASTAGAASGLGVGSSLAGAGGGSAGNGGSSVGGDDEDDSGRGASGHRRKQRHRKRGGNRRRGAQAGK